MAKKFRRRTSLRASDPSAQRLNKVLAAAGLGSRRKVEELIEQGRVEIDGTVVTDLACRVDPRVAKIKVDGSQLKQPRLVYFALNKPSGVLSTNYDPNGRMRVIDLVPDKDRVFSVGRLDQSSEGLMLLTNDGELAQRLAHPKFKIQKSYFVVVAGQMSAEELEKLRKGVHLAEGFARIDGATIKKHRQGCTEIEIILSEGKNREIRRILARAGHKVVLLRRIAIGPLRLGQLPVGASRTLNPVEVKALYAATDPTKRATKKPAPAAARTKKKSAAADKSPSNQIEDEDDDVLMVQFNEADDDFVGDFSGEGSVGSVISYDENPAPEMPKPARRETKPARRETKPRGRRVSTSDGRARKEASGRSTESQRDATPRGAKKKAPKKNGTSSSRGVTQRGGAGSTRSMRKGASEPPSRGKRSSLGKKKGGKK